MNAYLRKSGNLALLKSWTNGTWKMMAFCRIFRWTCLVGTRTLWPQSQPRLRARPLPGWVVQNFFANRKPRQTESFIKPGGYCWVVALRVDNGVANENHPKKECQPGDFTIFCSCCSQKWSYMNGLSKQPVFMSTKHHAKMPKSLQVQY